MTQHPIDLFPEFLRIRCQQGMRTGRYITAVVAAIVIVVIATTHMRFELDRSRERLAKAEAQANIVLQLEDRAASLTQALDEAGLLISLHEALRFPFEVSRLLSTMINQLPESATIERMDIDAQPRRTMQSSSQQRGHDEQTPRRFSVGELSGFAASDDDIAELVARMESSRIFQTVTWDFSRSRVVRERPAREFRVSFQIDLDQGYEILSDSEPLLEGDDTSQARQSPLSAERSANDERSRGNISLAQSASTD